VQTVVPDHLRRAACSLFSPERPGARLSLACGNTDVTRVPKIEGDDAGDPGFRDAELLVDGKQLVDQLVSQLKAAAAVAPRG
jgi:hypothetical protein